ncbi:metallophosphoesterase [Ligilactobacillus agilis]|uniref:metallophosphoesterase n=1 Tax=Ligilactobacillus agilis TaxID=1601 RepID=UPI0024C3C089|nr:metallophosphoesterase [Ligilactobacillus agilis]
MKTILVGDLHLKAQIILPMVEQKVKELGIKRVILLGDYTDAYEQERNFDLYMNELDYLFIWKSKMKVFGVEVINLLGNHDVSYLTVTPRMYSLQDADGFLSVGRKLLKLNLQIAFQLDDYLISHAGYTQDFDLEDWHFETITENLIDNLDDLEDHVGKARGGKYFLGSPLWADFDHELSCLPNPKYQKQIVGHTPQTKITTVHKGEFELVGIDTFTINLIKRKPFFEESGSGEILLYEDSTLTPIQLDWQSAEVFEKLNKTFERSRRVAKLHGIILDFEKWSITVEDKEIFLTNKEFDIFVYFLEHEGNKVSSTEINSKILTHYEKNVTLTESIDSLNAKIQPLKIQQLSDDEFIFER